MADLVYTIKTPAELEGAKQAEEALEKQIGKAKALGKEYGELERRLARVRESIANFTPPPPTPPPAHPGKYDLQNIKLQELKKLTQELGRTLPGFGQLLGALLNPRTVGLTLAVAAVRGLQTQIKNLMDLLEPSEWQGRGDAIRAGLSAFDDGAAAAAGFADELERGATETDKIVGATQQLIAELHDVAAAQAAVRNAEKGLALEQINTAQKKGLITPEQAVNARAGVEKKFSARERDEQKQAADLEYNAWLTQQGKLRHRQGQLADQVPGAQEASGRAQQRQARESAEAATYASNIANAEAKIAQLEKEQEDRKNFGMRSSTFDSLTDKSVQQALDSEISARDAARRGLKKLETESLPHRIKDEQTIRDTSALEAELRAVTEQLRRMNDEAAAKKAGHDRAERTRETVATLEDQTTSVKAEGDAETRRKQEEKRQAQERKQRGTEADQDVEKGFSAVTDGVAGLKDQVLVAMSTLAEQLRETNGAVGNATGRIQDTLNS